MTINDFANFWNIFAVRVFDWSSIFFDKNFLCAYDLEISLAMWFMLGKLGNHFRILLAQKATVLQKNIALLDV